uniref:Putative rho/rac guanine nucleotide exchange factor/faciogenital dysplasia protein 3 n=1 Tax=Lutzomyia longipalpis TaxID=7200 RepID=A0A1B0C9G2_LUTLO
MTPPTLQKCLSRELQEVLNQRNLLTVKSRQKMCHLLDSLSTETEECDKRRSLRRQAVQEIISSEQSYMQQLKILIDFFVRPLESQQIIDTATHGTLFGHIEMMFNLNGELLRELQEDRDCVAGAFLKLAPFFRLYSVYAFDYKKALLRLQELTAKNTAFRQFLANTESRPEVQTKLNSLLIAPIQRVPRYRLLLQQVLLYTSPSDGDFAALQASVKEVETTVEHIDSLVEEQENTQQMINLQNALVSRTPAIIKPGRRLFREGVLEKVSSTGGHLRRHCALMSDIFMYSKILRERSKANLPENSLQCCCIFPLKKTKITELFPGTFRISCQGDGVIFRTLDMLEGQSWVVAMQEAIAMHIEFRKTLRKESSKRRPLRRKKDVRNFESDTILSPRRRGDFENVFRTHVEGADEAADGQKRTCFHLNPVNLLKRRTQERTSHQMPPKKILRQKSPMRDVLFPLREIQEPQDAEDSAGGRETASVRRRVTFEDPPVSRIAMLEESRTSHQYEGIIPRLPNVSSIRDRILQVK